MFEQMSCIKAYLMLIYLIVIFGENMTDIEIAKKCKMKDVVEVARSLGVNVDSLETYGKYKAKMDIGKLNPKGKLVLVTAINPTKFGEGKTTVSIGLADAMNLIGKKTSLALREPSMGPVFGAKGGATGGGYSQVVPMEDINLHFTGDFHAITSANNLLCAMIDNHIFQGNALNIEKVVFNRCMDANDRALRSVKVGFDKSGSFVRDDRFNITPASEMMSIFCLSENLDDLKNKLGNILVAYDKQGRAIFARDLHCVDALAIILKDAIKPNLVQTLGGTPAIIHGGPFANIAHGCNSILATKLSMTYSPYTITEAGFGADLGAEKFLDLKCRKAGLSPNAVVLVATIRALKLHGGADENNVDEQNMQALTLGMKNLYKHIDNLSKVFTMPVVVSLNKFATDKEEEISFVTNAVRAYGYDCYPIDVWAKGGKGALDLARKVVEMCDKPSLLTYSYNIKDSIQDKIYKIATKVYGAKDVEYTKTALEDLKEIEQLGLSNFPVVIAKTQYSLSDNAKLLGAPTGWTLKVKELQIRHGAGFIVAVAGSILLMPGLPKNPAGCNMIIDSKGNISGLF